MDDFCLTDRGRLTTELIAAVPADLLNRMFPPCLKDKSHKEVYDVIREQLECMSKERITALLKGEAYTSEEETSESDENMEEDEKVAESESEDLDEREDVDEQNEDEEEEDSDEEDLELIPMTEEQKDAENKRRAIIESREDVEDGEVVESSPEFAFEP